VDTAIDLAGARVRLRPGTAADAAVLAAIRAEDGVRRWWGEPDPEEIRESLIDGATPGAEVVVLVIETEGEVVGAIQFEEGSDPDYRHAGIDIYLATRAHGRGLGREAVALLASYLCEVRGHHRLVIDPAADNAAGIRCYASVGFKPVGRMREYELGADGTWHDGLLMDLLARELRVPPPRA
jgi:aminoglycoside 6'-N-acetyltransferase